MRQGRRDMGFECTVVAPSLTPWRPADQVKTNRRNAIGLARLLRAGELTAVWVPNEGHEAMRDLVRGRSAAVETQRLHPVLRWSQPFSRPTSHGYCRTRSQNGLSPAIPRLLPACQFDESAFHEGGLISAKGLVETEGRLGSNGAAAWNLAIRKASATRRKGRSSTSCAVVAMR